MGMRALNPRPTGFCTRRPSAAGDLHPDADLRRPPGHRDPRSTRRGPSPEIPGIRYPGDDADRGAPRRRELGPGLSGLRAAAGTHGGGEAGLDGGYNQYSITWGARELRDAIARRAKTFNGIDADPETNLVVTCGSTEAMMAAMLSLINPGDEAVIFEPFYENYGPDAIVSGAR